MSRCWLQRFKSVAKNSSSVHVRGLASGGGEVARSRTRFESLVDRTTIYQLDTMASQSPSPLSIKSLLDQASQPSQERSFYFLKRELPIRLANTIMELNYLPLVITKQKMFQDVLHQYLQSFKELVAISELEFSDSNNELLVESLKRVRKRHRGTVPTMAAAVQAMVAEEAETSPLPAAATQLLLDRLHTSWVAAHLLVSVHQAVHSRDPRWMERTVSAGCDVIKIVQDAFERAAFLCEREYQESPELELTGRDAAAAEKGADVGEILISHVPAHLHHIFFEIFKNAMRATVEYTRLQDAVQELPPVRVLVSRGCGEVSVRVSDQGGGIPRDQVERAWHYNYSTARPAHGDRNVLVPGIHAHPMAGLGYGLPLSRVYARYFQGDLALMSMHGLGSDVFLHLKTEAASTRECLPKFSVATIEAFNTHNKHKTSHWTV